MTSAFVRVAGFVEAEARAGRPTSSAREANNGLLYVWDGVTLSLGRTRTAPHDCPAITIGVSLDETIAVRTPGGAWATSRASAMPAHVVHETRGARRLVLAILVDPYVFGMSLPRYTELPRALIAELVDGRREEWNEARAVHAVSRALHWLRSVASPLRMDSRIRRLAELIDTEPSARPSLEDAASRIGLSADHASRLFREQMRVSVPVYRLWRRMHRVARELCAGASATDAALAAGFADGAHLSRVTRRFLGIAPRTIQHWHPTRATPTTFGF